MSFMDFSSWPREQEQSFVVYEQHAAESSKKALTIGSICGAVFLVFMVFVYAGVEPEHKDLTQGMNMDNLTKKSKTREAPAPAPAEKAEPKEAPAPAPAEKAEKAEGEE
jgi:hypothetical protein